MRRVNAPLPWWRYLKMPSDRRFVPLFVLETQAEVDLAGLRLPARTAVIALMRPPMLDERHFEQPGRFRPERWLPAEEPVLQPSGPTCPFHAIRPPVHNARAWAQFGAGPRVCPGRHLAGNEIRLVLSMLMRHFRIEHAVDPASISEVNAFTMMPSRMPLRLQPR